MKRLLLILILTLSFQSWTKADDIRDFEIEGMSIGDSVLDFFDETKINNSRKYNFPKSDKYYSFDIMNNTDRLYHGFQMHVKSNDDKYIISGFSGALIS